MFFIKKFISGFLQPMPLMALIIFTGLLLCYLKKKEKLGKSLITVGAIGILLMNFTSLPSLLLKGIEREYPAILKINPKVKYIAVLGNGHFSDSSLPASSQLSSTALARLIEGVRLWRQSTNAKLILSGASFHDSVSNAEMMSIAAQDMGVPKELIILCPLNKDTREEALSFRTIVGDEKLYLVTSASHMKRAVGLCRKVKLKLIPAPCNYLASHYGSFVFSGSRGALEQRKMERYTHETIGYWWGKLRGQI